jgi:hypothetical protein
MASRFVYSTSNLISHPLNRCLPIPTPWLYITILILSIVDSEVPPSINGIPEAPFSKTTTVEVLLLGRKGMGGRVLEDMDIIVEEEDTIVLVGMEEED